MESAPIGRKAGAPAGAVDQPLTGPESVQCDTDFCTEYIHSCECNCFFWMCDTFMGGANEERKETTISEHAL